MTPATPLLLEELAFLGRLRPAFTVQCRAAGDPLGAALLLQPFAEEQKAARRALVELARALAAGGWSVTRPDLFGTGDAAGAHAAATLAGWLDELRAWTPNGASAIVGVRLGAALGWLAAGEREVEHLVLIEPIVAGAAYLRQCRQRSALRREMTAGEGPEASGEGFDFDGFTVSDGLQRQLGELDLLTAPLPRAKRLLILQVSGSERIKKPFEELAARAREGGLEVTVANVAVEPFWSAIGLVDTSPVTEAVLGWLGLDVADAPTVAHQPDPEPAPIDDGLTARLLPLTVDREPLACVCYEPAGGAPQRAVVLLHGWSGYRSGPGRLLTEAARAFARAGCAAISFDFRGRGDSGGEVGQASLKTMIADAVAAVPFVCEQTGAERVTLVGLCSGCEVAIGASLSDSRIDGLALWSAPVFGGELTLERRARRGRSALKGYLRKLLRPETYAKLLGGRLNWKLIARALGGGRSTEAAPAGDAQPDPAAALAAFGQFRGRLLFVYGGSDPETEPSRAFYRRVVDDHRLRAEFLEVAGANHNFYALSWKQQVIAATLAAFAEGGDG